jgi:hypothetical protein
MTKVPSAKAKARESADPRLGYPISPIRPTHLTRPIPFAFFFFRIDRRKAVLLIPLHHRDRDRDLSSRMNYIPCNNAQQVVEHNTYTSFYTMLSNPRAT